MNKQQEIFKNDQIHIKKNAVLKKWKMSKTVNHTHTALGKK